ncbi:MAG: dihydroneopterin aldolase [Fimbriimonadaceae bacterium]
MYTIFIDGLEVYAYHGVPAEERILGHRYGVDLSLSVEGSADETDKIGDTVDYGAIGAMVSDLMATSHAHTLEHLARTIAESLLEDQPLISEVFIRVSKPYPPTPIIAAAAGVELTVARV